MSSLLILVFSPESTFTLNLHCNLNVHYCKGHVETADTKDQSNAIVYWVWYLVCRHCRYEDQSMQCIECCAMSRLSILVFSPESTSTLNLHCNSNVHYCKGHVETVNTKDQSNAIVYWVWYLVCRHCRYEDQSMQCIECCAMSRLSILVFSPESTSTLNLHCNSNVHYCKGHSETVDTKDQSNAIVY